MTGSDPHDREPDEVDSDAFPPDDGSDDAPPLPPGVDTLQSAAREAISATRALLDVAEALVNDPETAERIGSVVRAATGAAARAARAASTAAGRETDHADRDDGSDGVQHIPVD